MNSVFTAASYILVHVPDMVVHNGTTPRYALITSFESGPALERWIDANRVRVDA